METSRLEIFADAVFAIAATLLILDVSVRAPGGELGAALEHSWPQYAAYAVSFVTIGIWWVNHHAVVVLIGRVDRTFLFATSRCSHASPSSRFRRGSWPSTSATTACARRRSPRG